jgi:hypothetical protein
MVVMVIKLWCWWFKNEWSMGGADLRMMLSALALRSKCQTSSGCRGLPPPLSGRCLRLRRTTQHLQGEPSPCTCENRILCHWGFSRPCHLDPCTHFRDQAHVDQGGGEGSPDLAWAPSLTLRKSTSFAQLLLPRSSREAPGYIFAATTQLHCLQSSPPICVFRESACRATPGNQTTGRCPGDAVEQCCDSIEQRRPPADRRIKFDFCGLIYTPCLVDGGQPRGSSVRHDFAQTQ